MLGIQAEYLVRDINSPIYFHHEFWCYYYSNDAVKCILMPPQDLEKVAYFEKKNVD
jgi:hypothetical protein